MRIPVYIILFFLLITLGCSVVDKIVNKPPIINGVYALRTQINAKDTTTVWVAAEDPDGDKLSYTWSSENSGHFTSETGVAVVWNAPELSGNYNIFVRVRDEDGGEDKKYVTITVVGDETPVVQITHPQDRDVIPGRGVLSIEALAQHRLGIGKVEFFINDTLMETDLQAPYTYVWLLNGVSGEVKISAKAHRLRWIGNPGEDSVRVTIEGISGWPL
ncbi:hypothetical protein JXJ21_26355 [candidate division KSB1 bacterium]|nr:hypothetical protein [candidate division KSB1 bacterium]